MEEVDEYVAGSTKVKVITNGELGREVTCKRGL